MTGKRCGCGSGCKTFGECIRRKSLRVAYCRSASGQDATTQRKWDRELDAYKAARREGIQPDGTTMRQIEKARRVSDKTGVAYGSTNSG
jgi:hypothetical protein